MEYRCQYHRTARFDPRGVPRDGDGFEGLPGDSGIYGVPCYAGFACRHGHSMDRWRGGSLARRVPVGRTVQWPRGFRRAFQPFSDGGGVVSDRLYPFR